MYDDNEMSEGERALERAYAVLAQTAPTPEPPPQLIGMPRMTTRHTPEPPPRQAPMKVASARELAALQARVDQLEAALRREMAARQRELAEAAERRKADAAAVGNFIGEVRAQLLARITLIEQRADGVVLDLGDERRRRNA